MEGCLRQRRLKWCARRERWRSPPGTKAPRQLPPLLPHLRLAAIPHRLDNHRHRANLRQLEIGSVLLLVLLQSRITFATLPLTWAVVAIPRRSQSVRTRLRGDDHGRNQATPDRTTMMRNRSHEVRNCGRPCLQRRLTVRVMRKKRATKP